MFVPMPLLIPMGFLAFVAGAFLIFLFHMTMRDYGLCFIGKRELTMPNHLLLERWCIFYIPVYTYRGCHSLSTVFERD